MLCTCPVKISCQSQEMLLISINVTVFCEVKKFQMQSSATYVPRSHFWWTARPSQPRTGWTRRPRVSNPSDSRLDVTHTLHSCATINRMRKNTHIPLFYTYKYNSIICIVYIYTSCKGRQLYFPDPRMCATGRWLVVCAYFLVESGRLFSRWRNESHGKLISTNSHNFLAILRSGY